MKAGGKIYMEHILVIAEKTGSVAISIAKVIGATKRKMDTGEGNGYSVFGA